MKFETFKAALLLPMAGTAYVSAAAGVGRERSSRDVAKNGERNLQGASDSASAASVRRRLAPPACGDATCRLECKDRTPAPCGESDWDAVNCCGVCGELAPGELCPTTATPCDGVTCSAGSVCTDVDAPNYECPCPTPSADECNQSAGQGDCVPGNNADWSCSCSAGWGGVRCEVDAEDNCAGVTCSGRGACTDLVGDYTCVCDEPTGWTGKDCDVDVDECAEGTAGCPQGTTCRNTDGGFDCDATTSAPTRSLGPSSVPSPDPSDIPSMSILPSIDLCAACSSSTCIIGDQGTFTCKCPTHPDPCPTGQGCQDGINENYQCVSDGLCSDTGLPCSVDLDCFSCSGGTNDGDPCSIDNDCPDSPGSCAGGTNDGGDCSSDAACPGTGTCEKGKHNGNPCQTFADCNFSGKGCVGAPTCSGGDPGSCDTTAICDTIDHCDPNPCANGGVCTDIGTAFECDCSGTAFPSSPICSQTYGYASVGTCSNGVQSTAVPTEENTVFQFFATGDFPYDEEALTCIIDGLSKSGTDCEYCGTSNNNIVQTSNGCTYNGTTFGCAPGCTFEGREYNCWKNTTFPWIREQTQVDINLFIGDFLKGDGNAYENRGNGTGRCNPDSFQSRRDLFQLGKNSIATPGDNDWNECNGFGANNFYDNTNVIRRMWRDKFATETSLTNISRVAPGYGSTIHIRRDTIYKENFFFVHNDIAFIGVNIPAGVNNPYASVNANFVNTSLYEMHIAEHNIFEHAEHACNTVKSVVVASHGSYSSGVRNIIDEYFSNVCSKVVPILNVKGNGHDYCFSQTSSNELRLQTGGDTGSGSKPEQSDPHVVSVLVNPASPSEHYFHVEQNDEVSNTCDGFF